MTENDKTLEMSGDSSDDKTAQAIDRLNNTLNVRLGNLEAKFDSLRKFVEMQFDAVQNGIATNSAGFDRLEAKFHDNRSDILRLRADIKDLHEEIRRLRNEGYGFAETGAA